jgi:hypothetical protein
MSIQVFIDYHQKNTSEWITIELKPEEYFDVESDAEITWNSIPRFDNAIDYLDLEKSAINNTRIRISDSQFNLGRTISTTFWNGGENQIIERVDEGKNDMQIIITNKIQENPDIWEIMRFKKQNHTLQIEFHSFIQEDENEFQVEKVIFPEKSDNQEMTTDLFDRSLNLDGGN